MPSEEVTDIKRRYQGFYTRFILFLYGMGIGCADLVPGVSGGTVAYILGVYYDLINSIKSINLKACFSLCTLDIRSFKKEISWEFLLILLSGICCSVFSLSQIVNIMLADELLRAILYSLFSGFICASVIFCARQLHSCHLKYVLIFFFSVIITVMFSTFQWTHVNDEHVLFDVALPLPIGIDNAFVIDNWDSDEKRLLNISESTLSAMLAKGIIDSQTMIYSRKDNLTGPAGNFVKPKAFLWFSPWIIAMGAFTICFTLLPGVSGSYFLSMIGLYPVIISALADFSHSIRMFSFDKDAFFVLANLAVGILIGSAIFSRILNSLLNSYHDSIISALTGVLLGSLPTIWPFCHYSHILDPLHLNKGVQLKPVSLFIPSLSSERLWLSLSFVLFGFALVVFCELMALSMRKSSKIRLLSKFALIGKMNYFFCKFFDKF